MQKREDGETEADHLPAEGHDLVRHTWRRMLLYQELAVRGKRVDEHEDQRRYGPHDVSWRPSRACPGVRDAEEEEEPREESHAPVGSSPDRKAQTV